MKPLHSFLSQLWRYAKSAKPFVLSPVMAPIGVVLAGLVLHVGFAPQAVRGEMVLGGATEPSIAILESDSALVATPQLLEGDFIGDEIGPITGIYFDAASADQSLLFGKSQAPTSSGRRYRIGPADTIENIASHFGITEASIKRLNRSIAEPLIVGDEILLPETVEVRSNDTNGQYSASNLPTGFIRPAKGAISEPHGRFGGVDIPNVLGTTIVASSDGVVESTEYGWNGGYGNRIIIVHADIGVKTLYAHLQDFLIKPGDVVKKGQPIGLMGSTGQSTGSHVHFEVR